MESRLATWSVMKAFETRDECEQGHRDELRAIKPSKDINVQGTAIVMSPRKGDTKNTMAFYECFPSGTDPRPK